MQKNIKFRTFLRKLIVIPAHYKAKKQKLLQKLQKQKIIIGKKIYQEKFMKIL